jgi:hypothetical protein
MSSILRDRIQGKDSLPFTGRGCPPVGYTKTVIQTGNIFPAGITRGYPAVNKKVKYSAGQLFR